MRLWLMVPPRPREQLLNLIPPFGLGYLAAACRPAGHEVRVLDAALEGWSAAEIKDRIATERPDAVGFTVFSSDLSTVRDLCQAIKQLPHPPVVLLGGIHPSSFPLPTLDQVPDADYLFAGEAETGLPLLLSHLEQDHPPARSLLASVPGLGFRWEGKAQVNTRARQNDLAQLGMPAWDLLSPLRYQDFPPTLFVRRRPFAPLITSRGCPYHCTYCGGHNVSGYQLRQRPLNLVFQEIELLVQKYGIRELHIEDDNFTLNRKRVVEFCERLLKTDWKLTWTMPNGVRLDTLDLDLLKLMKRAGCYFLILGVESGSDRILEHMQKQLTVAEVEAKTALVHQAGILAHAFFMLGYPEETGEDIEATRRLALRLPLVGAHFSSFRPLPGTECSDELIARGEIGSVDFSAEQGTFASVVYAPRHLTVREVKALQKRMLTSFYLRPRILWFYFLALLQHPGLAKNLFRRAWLYLFKKT